MESNTIKKEKVIINTHYNNGFISSKKLTDDLSFIFHVNFQFVTSFYAEHRPKKIVLVEHGEVPEHKLELICNRFNLPFEVKNEPLNDYGFALNKIGDRDYYKNLLDEIYSDQQDVVTN